MKREYDVVLKVRDTYINIFPYKHVSSRELNESINTPGIIVQDMIDGLNQLELRFSPIYNGMEIAEDLEKIMKEMDLKTFSIQDLRGK